MLPEHHHADPGSKVVSTAEPSDCTAWHKQSNENLIALGATAKNPQQGSSHWERQLCGSQWELGAASRLLNKVLLLACMLLSIHPFIHLPCPFVREKAHESMGEWPVACMPIQDLRQESAGGARLVLHIPAHHELGSAQVLLLLYNISQDCMFWCQTDGLQ